MHRCLRTPALLNSPLASANNETVSLWPTVRRKLQLNMAVLCSVFSWRSLWGMGVCTDGYHIHTLIHIHSCTYPHTHMLLYIHSNSYTLIHTEL